MQPRRRPHSGKDNLFKAFVEVNPRTMVRGLVGDIEPSIGSTVRQFIRIGTSKKGLLKIKEAHKEMQDDLHEN